MIVRTRIECPNGHRLAAPSNDVVGKNVRCSQCSTAFKVSEDSIVQALKKRPRNRRTRAKPEQVETGIVEQENLHPHSLNRVALYIGDNPIYAGDLIHTLPIGRTGSGKTSAILGRVLLPALLNKDGANCGGFLICFKSSDRATYLRIMEENGRLDDVVEINIDSGHVFNAFELERDALGEECPNACVELVDMLGKLADRNRGDGGGEAFWRLAARNAVRMACHALLLAELPLTFPDITRILNSIPHEEELNDEQWLDGSYCVNVMDLIEGRQASGDLSETEQLTYQALGQYFFVEMNRLALRTKSSVISQATVVAGNFNTGRFRKLFCGETNTIRVADAWGDKATLFLVDFNEETYQGVGKLATGIVRRQIMREIQRRQIDDPESARLVFLLQDEYPRHIADPDFEETFLATAREKKVAVISCLQSVDQLTSVCGKQETGNALLQNHFLKFLLANDGATAQWCSTLLGQYWSFVEYAGQATGRPGEGNAGASKQLVDYLLPEAWHHLKQGSARDNYLVGCIVFKGGRKFTNGLPYLHAEIDQRSKAEG